MTDIKPGDYIAFTTVVRPAVKGFHKDASGKKHEFEKEPAHWIVQGGSGYVLKVNKTAKKLGNGLGLYADEFPVKHNTARVDAGPVLGVVTVSIDDAVLIGVQTQLGIDVAEAAAAGMYDTRGDGA